MRRQDMQKAQNRWQFHDLHWQLTGESREIRKDSQLAGDNQSRPQPAPDSGDGFMNIPDGVDDLPFT